jgi:hypothetical protein
LAQKQLQRHGKRLRLAETPSKSSESVSVRDTKDRTGGTLTFGALQFAAFLDAVK